MQALTCTLHDIGNEIIQERKFGYYADLAQAKDVLTLKTILNTIINRLGFTDYSFINLECANVPQNQLNTIPRELLNNYYARDLYTHDMILQHGINTRTAFFGSTIHDYVALAPFASDMTRTMKSIYQLNKNYGFYDYFHIPHRSTAGYFLLSATIRGASPIEFRYKALNAKQSLTLLCEAIDCIVSKQFRYLLPTKTKKVAINPKPLRVLSTLANNDFTIEQVANKLCISVVTANQHLKTARQSLGVKTNYAAIKHALVGRLIQLDKKPEITIDRK